MPMDYSIVESQKCESFQNFMYRSCINMQQMNRLLEISSQILNGKLRLDSVHTYIINGLLKGDGNASKYVGSIKILIITIYVNIYTC